MFAIIIMRREQHEGIFSTASFNDDTFLSFLSDLAMEKWDQILEFPLKTHAHSRVRDYSRSSSPSHLFFCAKQKLKNLGDSRIDRKGACLHNADLSAVEHCEAVCSFLHDHGKRHPKVVNLNFNGATPPLSSSR